jgi:hypothetical protein
MRKIMKATKKKSSKTSPKKPKSFMTAKALGIMPEERKALIAFIKAPHLGNNIALNGKAHHYNQSYVDNEDHAEDSGCGTAGCVAGYVFWHAKIVQKLRKLRNTNNPDAYIEIVWSENKFWSEDNEIASEKNPMYCEPLQALYDEGEEHAVEETKKVVDKFLRTGKVCW